MKATKKKNPMSDPSKQANYAAPRSFRLAEKPWRAARTRAAQEGQTMSYVIATLVEGYGLGEVSLPKVEKVWPSGTTYSNDED